MTTPNPTEIPITVERARRSLPYFLQVVLAVCLVGLLSLTAIIFLTSSTSQDEVIEDLVTRIDERMQVNDERMLCILDIIIRVPPPRDPGIVAACDPAS